MRRLGHLEAFQLVLHPHFFNENSLATDAPLVVTHTHSNGHQVTMVANPHTSIVAGSAGIACHVNSDVKTQTKVIITIRYLVLDQKVAQRAHGSCAHQGIAKEIEKILLHRIIADTRKLQAWLGHSFQLCTESTG